MCLVSIARAFRAANMAINQEAQWDKDKWDKHTMLFINKKTSQPPPEGILRQAT